MREDSTLTRISCLKLFCQGNSPLATLLQHFCFFAFAVVQVFIEVCEIYVAVLEELDTGVDTGDGVVRLAHSRTLLSAVVRVFTEKILKV